MPPDDDLSETQQRLLRFIRREGPTLMRELPSALSLPRGTVSSALNKLDDDDYITRRPAVSGRDRNWWYDPKCHEDPYADYLDPETPLADLI